MDEKENPIYTYQTRVAVATEPDLALQDYARLFGQVERKLFSDLAAGEKANDQKAEFQKRYEITARQYNAISFELQGKIAAIRELQPQHVADAKARIKKAEKLIVRMEKTQRGSNKLHQKKRRLINLYTRLKAMEADIAAGKVRLCFGSKKLFRAQFALEENGFADQAAWKEAWAAARSSQFFVLGSKDEITGNQSCQATVATNGSLTLKLRLPDALAGTYGEFLTLSGVTFAYGHEKILFALASSKRIKATTKKGKAISKYTGQAISYRFLRDQKGWRIFASLAVAPAKTVTRSQAGVIGIDINPDRLAIAETDRFGNLIGISQILCPVAGKTEHQTEAILGDAAVRIAKMAKKAGKPVVLEELDFQKKKTELEAFEPKAAKALSSFAYKKTISSIQAACSRVGVEVVLVNPAYTSVIGAVNYARKYGISIHLGAAYAIARRGLRLSERPSCRTAVVPVRRGGHVTFALPVRKRAKHVWPFWAATKTSLKTALRAHFRRGDHKKPPPPLSQLLAAVRVPRISTAKTRGASTQHCSVCA